MNIGAAIAALKKIEDWAMAVDVFPFDSHQVGAWAAEALSALDGSADQFTWPTDLRPVYITQFFGDNPMNYARFGLPGHEGLDIRTGMTGKILAIYPGTIYRVELNASSGPYGVHVRVQHVLADGSIIRSMYAHLSAIDPQIVQGAIVAAGDVLGICGKTGNAPAIHLHLTIKDAQDRYVDPLAYLAKAYQDLHGTQSLPAIKLAFAVKK